MPHVPKPPRRRGLSLNAAVLLTLASAPVLASQVYAQDGQGMSNMQDMPGMGGAKVTTAASAPATGTVESVNAHQRKIKLNHGPIPAIGWPAMSMEFAAAPSVDLAEVKPGSKVKFTLSKGGDGTYTVDSLSAQ